MALQITSAGADPALLDLPWRLPLEEWPEEILAALPRGISRHVVRFVRLSGRVVAIKEIKAEIASREYQMLRNLNRLEPPPSNRMPWSLRSRGRRRRTLDSMPAHPAPAVLAALPVAVLQPAPRETAVRLIDAMAVLLVRLHLAGFLWGDVSLSNISSAATPASSRPTSSTPRPASCTTPLRRPARTRPRHRRVNLFGEFIRPRGEGTAPRGLDPLALVSEQIETRYHELWQQLTGVEEFAGSERWPASSRESGGSTSLASTSPNSTSTDLGHGTTIRIQPKVVDAGHHSRRLLRLTGLDTEENQARRLLNDLDTYRAAHEPRATSRSRRRPPVAEQRRSCRSSRRSRRTWQANASRRRSSTRCSTTAGTWPSGPSTTFTSDRSALTDYLSSDPAGQARRACRWSESTPWRCRSRGSRTDALWAIDRAWS
jgi:hypothetical protein